MRPSRFEEIELKLAVSPADAADVLQHPRLAGIERDASRVRNLDSVYFDTQDFDLARRGFVLRLRTGGPETIQAVKTRTAGTAGLFRRGEWEIPVDGDVPDLSRIPNRKLRKRLEAAVGRDELLPIVRTQVQRTSLSVEDADWAVRVDLDIGEAKTLKGSLPIGELELELLRGSPVALYDLALELLEHAPLRVVGLGQAEAGLALLLGGSPRPRAMPALDLAADASLDDVMAEIFAACLDQILANEAVARAGVDPEGVHRVRVAARRMRSAFALFGDSIAADTRQRFRDELRWLAGELADARDLDVFLAETLEPILEQTAGCRELADLERVLRGMRAAGYDRARTALESRRFVQLVLTLGAWLAGRGWGAPGGESPGEALSAPARDAVALLLARRYDKACALGTGVSELSPEDAHRLRIELKKLRYACEFLGGMYRRRRAQRFVKRVARLQQTLGRLNDQQTARKILAGALEQGARDPVGPVTAWAVGFVSGWSSRVALEDLRPLERDWKRFAKLDPFWRAALRETE